MKAAWVVLGVVLCATTAVAGCGAGFVRLLYYEPPHPSFSFDTEAAPSAQETPPLGAGDHVVWVSNRLGGLDLEGPCRLDVRRADGSAVGADQGTSCSVHATARAGEVWRIEASGPRARVNAGVDVAFFVRPFDWIALCLCVCFVSGFVLFVAGLARSEPRGGVDE